MFRWAGLTLYCVARCLTFNRVLQSVWEHTILFIRSDLKVLALFGYFLQVGSFVKPRSSLLFPRSQILANECMAIYTSLPLSSV